MKLVLTVGSAVAKELLVLSGLSREICLVSATRQPLLVTGAGKPWRARMSTTQKNMIVAFNHRHAIETQGTRAQNVTSTVAFNGESSLLQKG